MMRQFRMSTSFYLPAEGFADKIVAMRRYLNEQAKDLCYPTVTGDERHHRARVDLIVAAGTWVEAGRKADEALQAALDAAGVAVVSANTAESIFDNSVREMALV